MYGFSGIFCYVRVSSSFDFYEYFSGASTPSEDRGRAKHQLFLGFNDCWMFVCMFLLKLIDRSVCCKISGILSMSLLLIALFGSAESGVGFSCNRLLYLHDVLHSIFTCPEYSNPESRFFCRHPLFRNSGRCRWPAARQPGIRRHFVANGNVTYSDFHGIHYVYRLLGTSFG